MKTIIFTFMFIFTLVSINAQNSNCGYTPIEPLLASTVAWDAIDQSQISSDYSEETIYVLKVKFWDINDDDGNNENPLTETQRLDVIARLNRDFNIFKIFFKYDGFSFLNNTDFTIIDYNGGEPSVLTDFLDANPEYYELGTINIYSVKSINNPEGVAAYYTRESNGKFGTIISEHQYITDTHVMTHEVAHYFGLLHVFGPDYFGHYENVIRQETSQYFNAEYAGDRVVDTNATPENMAYDPNLCTYIYQGETDQVGFPYNYHGLEPEVKNFMSYAHSCSDFFIFTPGQIARMRNYLLVWDHHPQVTLYQSVHVSELYKPYKGEYYFAGSLPVDEGGHLNPPLFQYGFDYVFYDTTQANIYNQPSSYENTSFFWYGSTVQSYDINHNSPIEHKNHTAFKILQVDIDTPRICYNNFNKAPIGGTLIKFLDDVPNTNVNITAQDSLQINNTNFFQNLEPGLYNIQKSYNDGTTEENLILKENN